MSTGSPVHSVILPICVVLSSDSAGDNRRACCKSRSTASLPQPRRKKKRLKSSRHSQRICVPVQHERTIRPPRPETQTPLPKGRQRLKEALRSPGCRWMTPSSQVCSKASGRPWRSARGAIPEAREEMRAVVAALSARRTCARDTGGMSPPGVNGLGNAMQFLNLRELARPKRPIPLNR